MIPVEVHAGQGVVGWRAGGLSDWAGALIKGLLSSRVWLSGFGRPVKRRQPHTQRKQTLDKSPRRCCTTSCDVAGVLSSKCVRARLWETPPAR